MATFKLPDPNAPAFAVPTKIVGTDGNYYYLQPAQPLAGVPAMWYGSTNKGATLFPVDNPTTSPTINNKVAPLSQKTFAAQIENQARQALAKVTTSDQLADIQSRAQTAGITLNQGYVDVANANIKQIAAKAAAAEKAAADKVAAEKAAVEKTAANKAAADKMAAEKAAATEKFVAELPAVGSEQANYLRSNQFDVTAPDGSQYRIVPGNAAKGTPDQWVKSTDSGKTYTPVSGTGPAITQSDIKTVIQSNIDYQNQQQQAAQAAQQQAAKETAATQAAAESARAAQIKQQQDFSNQIINASNAGELTTQKFNSIVQSAQAAGVTLPQNTIDQWTVKAQETDTRLVEQAQRQQEQQAAQQQRDQAAYAEAAKLPAPTQAGNKFINGYNFEAVPDDPTTAENEAGYFVQTAQGLQKIGADGQLSGPVVPNFEEFNRLRSTIQANTQEYETQQAALAAEATAAEKAKYYADFESKLPDPNSRPGGATEYAEGGVTYYLTPKNLQTGEAGRWIKLDENLQNTDLATGKSIGGMMDYNKMLGQINDANNVVYQQQREALIAQQVKDREGDGFFEGIGNFLSSDAGKLLIIAGIGYALWSSGVFSGFGEAASVSDISAAAEGLASQGMSSAEIAAELSSTFGIDAAAAETAASLATEISAGALDAASLLPDTITSEMLANAAATGDPIAALNASAGWGASDIGYLQSIGAAPDLIATAGANNIALGFDAYGLNILNAAETANLLSGVDPAFVNFLTEEAVGSAAADALGTGLTMGSSGLGMTYGTVPGLASMGGAGGLTIPAAGGGILSELGVFFPGALALSAIGGGLGTGAAAAGLPPGSVFEPPLSPLTPGSVNPPSPVTPVEATPPIPEGPMGPPAPVEAVAPPAPAELGGFKPGTAPGSPGLGMTPGTGVPPLAEMGGAGGLTIPAAGGGTLSAAGVTAAGAGGAALLGDLGSGAAAAGVPEGVISAPVAPAPQPNLTEMGGGQGMNPAAPAETGITAGSAPAAAEMGGAQGLTIPAAGGGTLTEAGVALGAGSGLAGSLGTASEAVATSLPSNTNVPTTSGAVSPGPEVIDRAPDYTNPNPTPDRSVLDQVKDLTGASNLDLLGAGAAVIGAATAPKPPEPKGYGPINYLPFASLKALEPPGANPGLFVRPDAFYNTTSPVQSQYYWGQHPYQSGSTFSQSEYNNVPSAPAVPFGLREMYTPTNLNAYLTQLTQNTGPVAPR